MKMKRLTDWQVQIAFGSAIVILLVVAAFSYRGIVASQEGARWLAHTHEVRETLQRLQTTIEQVQSSSRAFVLTGSKVYLESFAAGVLRARQLQAAVRGLTADNAEQQRQLPALESLITQKIEFAERVTDLRRRSGLEPAAAAIRAGGGQRVMNDIGAAIERLQATEQQLLTLRTSKAEGRVAESKTVLILGTVLGLLITAAAGWIVQRDISRRRRAEEALKRSEEDYRMLLDGVEDYAIFMLGPQGEIVTWNSGAERTNGYAAHEIIGKNFSCFFCPEEIERGTPEQLLRIAAAKGRYEDQGMRVRKDGSQFLTSSILTALRDPAGELQGFSEICRDISETKEAQAKYRGLLEAAPDAMVVVNQAGEIVLLNVQAEKQFGYHRDELIGQKVTNIIPIGFAERLIADDLRTADDALAQQIGTGIELTALRKDRSEFPIEIMLSPLKSDEGILVTAAIRDISVRTAADRHRAQMEGRYRGLLEAAPDAMVVVNQAGEIVLLNVQAEKQFGYRRDELIGQKVTNIIPIGFAERLIADDLRTADDALAQQIGTGIELTALRKDRSEFPIEIMLSPLKSDEGILVTAAIRDISVRMAADRLRAQMESRYRGLLEAAPDAMVVVDQAGEIVLLNVQAEKQFGYRRDELIGQKITNIIPIGFAERLIADDLRTADDALAQQIGTGIELTALRKNGSEFPIEIMLSPLKSDEGILVTAAIRDISVRNRQTARVKRLKDEFIATVSHELRTPLTSIAGALSLLSAGSGGKLPKTASQFIEIAYTNSKRLVRLINDVLDIEKIEAGKFELVLEPVDIHSVLEQAMEDTQAYAKSHSVRIRIEASPKLSEVQSDPDWLVQIVTNLLANAIKFSPPDGEVVLAAAMRDGLTHISVRDHGPGVPADFKPQIFEKFAQADGSDTRQKGGTGLGLSIVKQMVTRLGGEVGFDDAPGGGAIFHVDLPDTQPVRTSAQ